MTWTFEKMRVVKLTNHGEIAMVRRCREDNLDYGFVY
jgi:hypothetical protein